MSYLRHVRACNAHDLSRYRPFVVAGRRVGWVRHGFAERLREFPGTFLVSADSVALSDRLDGFDARTHAVAEAVSRLVDEGTIQPLRHEDYGVVTRWGEAPLFRLDRTAVPHFGVRSFGLHVNGFVRRPDGPHLWVAKRASDRRIDPGKLDNMIAGGQPFGLTLAENLVKEAGEEAGLSPESARRATPVGVITYLKENTHGMKPDTLFVYDLEMEEGAVPRNTDGEVESFELWPLDRVARVVRETDDFKFNVNLVLIDFMIRHGHLDPDDPEYPSLSVGLRRPDV